MTDRSSAAFSQDFLGSGKPRSGEDLDKLREELKDKSDQLSRREIDYEKALDRISALEDDARHDKTEIRILEDKLDEERRNEIRDARLNKALAEERRIRIEILERELASSKQRAANLQHDLTVQHEAFKQRLVEINELKKTRDDLVINLKTSSDGFERAENDCDDLEKKLKAQEASMERLADLEDAMEELFPSEAPFESMSVSEIASFITEQRRQQPSHRNSPELSPIEPMRRPQKSRQLSLADELRRRDKDPASEHEEDPTIHGGSLFSAADRADEPGSSTPALLSTTSTTVKPDARRDLVDDPTQTSPTEYKTEDDLTISTTRGEAQNASGTTTRGVNKPPGAFPSSSSTSETFEPPTSAQGLDVKSPKSQSSSIRSPKIQGDLTSQSHAKTPKDSSSSSLSPSSGRSHCDHDALELLSLFPLWIWLLPLLLLALGMLAYQQEQSKWLAANELTRQTVETLRVGGHYFFNFDSDAGWMGRMFFNAENLIGVNRAISG